MLVLMGISTVAVLGVDSPLKGFCSAGLGFTLSFVGYQAVTGFARFTFGVLYLFDGIELVVVALGMFAMPEIIDLITTGESIAKVRVSTPTRTDLLEGIKDVFRHWGLFIRSCIVGLVIGIAPGVGGTAAAWLAYSQAKQTSKHPERFGTGCIEGVIAPEASNGADHGGGMIPTLAFAVPGSGSMAILLGILVILGITPGPFLIRDHANLVFSMVAIMITSHILGAVILLLGCAQLSKIAFIRGHIMGPSILILVTIGAYSIDNNILDVLTCLIVGGIAYLMRHLHYSRPAFFLGFLLGNLAERYFYLSLGSYGWSFFFLPIPFVLIVLTILMVNYEKIYSGIKMLFRGRTR
jgi:TctA family transporter